MGIYKFGNNTYPWRIRHGLNLGHILRGKKCILWAGKYGNYQAEHLLCTKGYETTPKENSHTHTKHHILTPSCGKFLNFSLNTGDKWS